jgi:hypothetical protein
MTRKHFTATVAVAVLAFVVAFPALGACCITKAASGAASVHASMACCTEGCKLSTPNKNAGDRDVTATSAPSPGKTMPAASAIATLSSSDDAPGFDAAIDRSWDAFFHPPPFLLHRQFRI